MANDQSLHRLTREQFRALARSKGWKFKTLAQRWGVTPEWVSIVSRDLERDLRFDDALFGLPNLNYLARDLRRREIQVNEALASTQASPKPARDKLQAAGFRYRGYLPIGMVVATTNSFGTVSAEGERGIVFHSRIDYDEEVYGVIFEHGAFDWLTPALVDTHLASTGLIAVDCIAYHYVDDAILHADFIRGQFNFWPATPLE